MRKRAYGAAALFAFLVVQLWPAARYTQGHGLHWQLHLVAHAITGSGILTEWVFAAVRGSPTVPRMNNDPVDFSSPARVLQRQGRPTNSEPSTPWPNGHTESFNNCCASLFLHMAAAFPLRLIRV